ncbi:hypothetical protein [Mesorhizobium sp.]|uniref:hypothetical protein n=1 Tax=Mesorhizobium sp. TaxID=1871066 RepID=UPI000FE998DC|nr:hypothetical protein [Mesorhizobium sp.]RWP31772.1 MAG: hypothetical protein EOR02_08120 [Mesorhizobium sp.]
MTEATPLPELVLDAVVRTYKEAFAAKTYHILNTPSVGTYPIDIGDQATRAGLAAVAALGTQPVPAVAVKGLEWEEDWSGSNEDIPSWRGKNPLGLHVGVCFAGRLFNGAQIERHDDAPVDVLESAKAAAQADYEARIRSALAPATQAVPDMRPAVADIAAERQRQINVEGWTPEHDDQHDKGELAEAASCYARGSDRVTWMQPDPEFPRHKVMTGCIIWPWDLACWKPTDRRRNLVKAGALIAAEIDRLDRATPPKPSNTN